MQPSARHQKSAWGTQLFNDAKHEQRLSVLKELLNGTCDLLITNLMPYRCATTPLDKKKSKWNISYLVYLSQLVQWFPPPPVLQQAVHRTTTKLHPFSSCLSGTIWVNCYQKGKTKLDLNEATVLGTAVASVGPCANNLQLAPDR